MHPLPFPLSLFPSGHLLTSFSPTNIPCPRRSQTKVASVRVHLTRVINISSMPHPPTCDLLSPSPTADFSPTHQSPAFKIRLTALTYSTLVQSRTRNRTAEPKSKIIKDLHHVSHADSPDLHAERAHWGDADADACGWTRVPRSPFE